MAYHGKFQRFSLGARTLFLCEARPPSPRPRCGKAGRLHPHPGSVQLLFKHLICPYCLGEKYFSKIDSAEFSVWKHLLEEKIRVLLVNKPRAYCSVLKSAGFFFYQNKQYTVVRMKTFTHFWFFYYPIIWGTQSLLFWAGKKRGAATFKRIKISQ